MSFVQKVESGYLQFLRIVFLIFATGAIVVSGLLGAKYLMQHDAEPRLIKREISINVDGYHPPQKAVKAEPSVAPNGAPPTKDELLEQFKSAINELGREITPNFSVNEEPVINLFNSLENDPDLGRAFVEQFNGLLVGAKKRPDIIAKLKVNFDQELNDMLDYSKAEYLRQKAEIRSMNDVARADALAKQSDAMFALYASGVLFLFFVGLVLLIVLLKIERNLRAPTIFANKALA